MQQRLLSLFGNCMSYYLLHLKRNFQIQEKYYLNERFNEWFFVTVWEVYDIFNNSVIIIILFLSQCDNYTFEKRYLVFYIRRKICRWVGVCVCICLSVITFVARWLHSGTWCQVRSKLSINTRNCNTCQDNPFPDPDNMDQLDHITFWPITISLTSKLIYGFTPNFVCMQFSSGDSIYVAYFEIHI